MGRDMDWKKFLILYFPMALVLIIIGRLIPDWVRENYILYYVILVGLAFLAEQLSRIWAKKEDEKNNQNNQNNKRHKGGKK